MSDFKQYIKAGVKVVIYLIILDLLITNIALFRYLFVLALILGFAIGVLWTIGFMATETKILWREYKEDYEMNREYQDYHKKNSKDGGKLRSKVRTVVERLKEG